MLDIIIINNIIIIKHINKIYKYESSIQIIYLEAFLKKLLRTPHYLRPALNRKIRKNEEFKSLHVMKPNVVEEIGNQKQQWTRNTWRN